MFRRFFTAITLLLALGCQGTPTRPDYPISSHVDILRDGYHSKLLIEVITIGCEKPDPGALAFLQRKISKHCHKEIVSVYVNDPLPLTIAPTLIWDSVTLGWIESKVSRFRTTGDTLVVRILYIAGVYSPGPTTRGLAYGNYSFAVFRNTFAPEHERALLLHEFGHLMGLVNCGTPSVSDHAETDAEHKPHCRNQDKGCVMYWSAPTVPEPDFDDACKRDIVANGGKD